ncbi:MAG: excinuclease ABC subunit UvrA, partial [Lachnospiraceae bacterium]
LIHGTNKSVKVRYKGQRGEGVYDIVFEGLIKNVERRYRETGSETIKAEYETFMRITPCSTCKGMRLKRESLAVTVADKNIYEVTNLSIRDLASFLSNLTLTKTQQLIGEQILKEIRARVQFLIDVGLDYLCLSRATGTLSGGEAQRIRLATQIGSGLVGVAYILDEPSIGLHQRDNDKLLGTLKHLRDLGNSVIVVEHDEDTMRAADYVVDIGPGAGEHGGQVVAAGTAEELMKNPASITGKYLSGELKIPVPSTRREPQGWLTVVGAKENNLKNITVNFPKGVFTCVTGVSGSGKSSLVNSILYQALAKQLNRARTIPGAYKEIKGIEQFDKVINIDQSPIGRTPRSNPATYTGVFDMIRDLFASTVDAKTRGYNKGRFSFNVKGGRCEACSGDGIVKIEMHFLPDVYVPCEVCKGKRYNRETLEVKYKGKSIYDVLNMTVEEALTFFENVPSIYRKIQTLYQVGLSYIRLGQPSTTLSGGEAQRIKLATELSRKSTGKTIYILDEPTTGLHFADVHKLTEMLQKLVENGNTVIVIEHNLDVIKTADYIIDMGPEGGDGGGTVVAQGTPEEVAECPQSYTGYYVKRVIAHETPTI